MSEQAWAYSRDRLRPGLSYPVGQQQIMRVLHEAGAETNVSLRGRDGWQDSRSEALVVACWYPSMGGSVFLKRGAAPRGRTWLTVYAVPSGLRASAAGLLMNRTLLDACIWIRNAAGRADSAWAGSNHEWRASLRHGTLRIDEA